jgi:hypothetical protein
MSHTVAWEQLCLLLRTSQTFLPIINIKGGLKPSSPTSSRKIVRMWPSNRIAYESINLVNRREKMRRLRSIRSSSHGRYGINRRGLAPRIQSPVTYKFRKRISPTNYSTLKGNENKYHACPCTSNSRKRRIKGSHPKRWTTLSPISRTGKFTPRRPFMWHRRLRSPTGRKDMLLPETARRAVERRREGLRMWN